MLRVALLNVLLFLLPFLLYWLLLKLRGRARTVGDFWNEAPLLALVGVSALLILAVLLTFASFTGQSPSQPYRPYVEKDGHVETGGGS